MKVTIIDENGNEKIQVIVADIYLKYSDPMQFLGIPIHPRRTWENIKFSVSLQRDEYSIFWNMIHEPHSYLLRLNGAYKANVSGYFTQMQMVDTFDPRDNVIRLEVEFSIMEVTGMYVPDDFERAMLNAPTMEDAINAAIQLG